MSESNEDTLLDIEQAIKMLNTTRSTLYRWISQEEIKAIKVGRQWRFAKEEVDRFLKGEKPKLEISCEVEEAISQLDKMYLATKNIELQRTSDAVDDLLTRILTTAHELKATDIHIEPQPEGCRLRLRVDGVLNDISMFDKNLSAPLAKKMKGMFNGNIQECQIPQDGRGIMKIMDKEVDLRVSSSPSLHGETVVAHYVNKDGTSITFDNLPMRDYNRQKIENALMKHYGMIFVSGPFGSGKTTLTYSLLHHLNNPDIKLVTVEQPVEMAIKGAVQIPVKESEGLTFSTLSKTVLRQDPDILYIGEVQDKETVLNCTNASLTGHMVFSTLHANSNAAALKRLVNLGVTPFIIEDAVSIMISQRLIRNLCPACKATKPATDDDSAKFERLKAIAGKELVLPEKLSYSQGCDACKHLGYQGRHPILEVMEITPEITSLLMDEASIDELNLLAMSQGMVSLAEDGFHLVENGKTSLDELCRLLTV